MAEGIRIGGGGGSVKFFTGQMTLANNAKTLTIPNPFGSAEKVKKVNVDFKHKYNGSIDFIEARPTTGVIHYGDSVIDSISYRYTLYNNSAISNLITVNVTDNDIKFTFNNLSTFPNGDLVWEVIGIE